MTATNLSTDRILFRSPSVVYLVTFLILGSCESTGGNCHEGPVPATVETSIQAYNAEDYCSAFRGFEAKAAQGDPRAQHWLGWVYAQGHGVAKDSKKAVEWYRKAVEQNYASSQVNLGFMYEIGAGVPTDLSEAVKWYRLAADQGNVDGQINLANMYKDGDGVAQDYKRAVELYQKAAEKDVPRAYFWLAHMYEFGLGVPQDKQEAGRWYRKASASGNDWIKKQSLKALRRLD